MKKIILSAVAAGALAVTGAASAQGIGNAIDNVFSGLFGYGNGSSATPAVVAGAGANQTIHVDTYGRHFYYDQYGRQVFVEGNAGTYNRAVIDPYGRQVVLDEHGTYLDPYGVRMHVDAYGRHVRLDQYGSYRDQWGRKVYLGANRQPLYVEEGGRVMAISGTYGTIASNGTWDRDRDGVADHQDRYPDDYRYR